MRNATCLRTVSASRNHECSPGRLSIRWSWASDHSALVSRLTLSKRHCWDPANEGYRRMAGILNRNVRPISAARRLMEASTRQPPSDGKRLRGRLTLGSLAGGGPR